jgi:hypothetical protein
MKAMKSEEQSDVASPSPVAAASPLAASDVGDPASTR